MVHKRGNAMMNRKQRMLMTFAALILAGVFLMPIWTIDLQAPQYPEGIGLEIWINKIQGESPQDLQNINGLNHYIGMKTINPESIPELKIMPYFFGFLILGGLAVAGWGKRSALLAWVVIFAIMALAGLVDFYIWEYDYGHDLNPNAPIKVPGMSYQPPLIGTKQLLNMKTTSMPGYGFWIALVSMGMGASIWWRSRPDRGVDPFTGSEQDGTGSEDELRQTMQEKPGDRGKLSAVALPFLALLLLAGCDQEPHEIYLGEDSCDHCRMIIMDNRFASQIVTEKGKAFLFDSIECMAAFTAGDADLESAAFWVSDFEMPGEWVAINDASLIHHPDINSPMGLSLMAIPELRTESSQLINSGGVELSWREVQAMTGDNHSSSVENRPSIGNALGNENTHSVGHDSGLERAPEGEQRTVTDHHAQ